MSNIRNHDRKTYSKTGILLEEKILWNNHIVILSITTNFNESRFYLKSMQIIVRTNIMPNTCPIMTTITKQVTQTSFPFEISKLIHTLPKKNSPH